MTPQEFMEWFSYHCAAFPGVRAWFNKPESVPVPSPGVSWSGIVVCQGGERP
jgi:hypothetical protein